MAVRFGIEALLRHAKFLIAGFAGMLQSLIRTLVNATSLNSMRTPRAKQGPIVCCTAIQSTSYQTCLFMILVKCNLHPAAPANCVSIRGETLQCISIVSSECAQCISSVYSLTPSASSHEHARSAFYIYVEGPAFLLLVWASLSLSGWAFVPACALTKGIGEQSWSPIIHALSVTRCIRSSWNRLWNRLQTATSKLQCTLQATTSLASVDCCKVC